MARDFRVESYLTTEGVSWRYQDELPLTKIDVKKSLSNQSRLSITIDDDMVERYAAAMQEGAAFPAIVVYEDGRNYVVVTGNHRVEAALKTERPNFDAYVVRATDVMVLERITRGINGIEGLSPSKDELIAQALFMVQHYGRPVSEMAKAYKIPDHTLDRAVQEARTRDRVARMGSDPRGIPRTTLARLGAIQTDEPLRLAVEAVKAYALPDPMVGELIRDVRAARSEKGQIEAVAQFVARPDVERRRAETRNGASKVSAPQRAQLLRYLTGLKVLLERNGHPDLLQLTDQDDVDRVREAWNDLNQRMGIILTRASKGRLRAVGS